MRETLTRAGWPVDEEALPWIELVAAGIRNQLQALLDHPTLGTVAPEVDLDPSRAPKS